MEDFLNKLGNTDKSTSVHYEDRLNQTKLKRIEKSSKINELKNNTNLTKVQSKALSRLGISGYIGVGVRNENSDGTVTYQATVKHTKESKQTKILVSKDPKECAQAYDKYITDNNLNKPTNKDLGLL